MGAPVILSIGSINADLEFRNFRSLRDQGTIRTGGFAERPGGKGANAAFFTHRMGAPTILLGRVGSDHYADIALQPLRSAGMELSGVTITNEAPTGIAIVAVPKDGNKTMLCASNANMLWDASAIELVHKTILTAADNSILIADFETSRNVLEVAFTSAEQRGFRILVDPTFPEEIDLSLLRRFYAITPNQTEAEGLLERKIVTEEDAADAAKELHERGVDIVCVKLSRGGCVFCHQGEMSMLAAPKVEVVDKTGAGDAFVGALAAALYEGRRPVEAARWGVAASSISVTRMGAQASYPDRQEFLDFLSKLPK
ncbi:ribokinase [Sinorhizobium numidicum]|uniref:Ribokinase n=1 Tax=Sinorhizobium numidicum TaxID=680248 RepID=A0ABY8CQM0_9HYPH|nr:ribokinase [Sinorhizobium numidicum]WEX74477.1 ribokinase [Sinorhizobium numidicum]WEX80467.1 ribokinase [Sinorhizobium numidicum]